MRTPKASKGLYIPPHPVKAGDWQESGWRWDNGDGGTLDLPQEMDDLAWETDFGQQPFYFLALPFPPSANRYWRRGRHGVIHRSDEADAYIEAVKYACLSARLGEPLAGQLETTAWFWRDYAQRDLNNCTKILYDALQGLVYLNDNQICRESHVRDYDAQYPRVLLFVQEVIAADDWKVKETDKKRAARTRRELRKAAI